MKDVRAEARDLLREKEWRDCKASFRHFFAEHWQVVIPSRGKSKVEIRPEQLESAELFQAETRIAVLKARQIGWSTLVGAYTFWKAFFHDDQACLVLSRREEPEARLIVANIKVGFDNLPLWMRNRGPRIINNNLTKIVFSNGSVIESDSSKDNPARGRTLALLVLDEFGKFPNPDEAWGSALPATEYGQLIVIGNANGFGTMWHRLYTDAKEQRSNFTARFYPWNVVPHRDDDWYARETSSMTPAQRAAEYADDDETCWTKSGSPVFDADVIRSWDYEPGVRGTMTPNGFRPSHDGPAELWAEPELGHEYVIGVDTAEGLEHGDFSVVQVIDATTGWHVFELACRAEPITFAGIVVDVAHWYNRPLVVVENNRNGGTVIQEMRENYRYKKLYVERSINATMARRGTKYGFNTNVRTKPIAINGMWKVLYNETVRTLSSGLQAELLQYRYLADGSMTGSPHDDRVMAFAMACVGLGTMNVRLLPPEEQEPYEQPADDPRGLPTFAEYDQWIEQMEARELPMTPRRATTSVVVNGRARLRRYGSRSAGR